MFWFDGNEIFLSDKWNGTNITEKCFATQNDPHRDAFLVFWSIYAGNWQKTSLFIFGLKSGYLRMKLRDTQIVIFSQPFQKEENPE